MGWFSWIYHGKNEKQCYGDANCLFCFVRLLYYMVLLDIQSKLGWIK